MDKNLPKGHIFLFAGQGLLTFLLAFLAAMNIFSLFSRLQNFGEGILYFVLFALFANFVVWSLAIMKLIAVKSRSLMSFHSFNLAVCLIVLPVYRGILPSLAFSQCLRPVLNYAAGFFILYSLAGFMYLKIKKT